jgi:hypothetical protein
MVAVFRKTALAVVIGCIGSAAHADVLNFDDLGNALRFFTANYQGFKFGTNSAADTAWFHTGTATVDYTPHSGRVFAATDYQLYDNENPWEATQGITNTVDFTFDGAWFSGGDQVRYQLYNNGALVYTSADSAMLSAVSSWVPSGYTGLVDEVVIVGRQGFYAMDDFTFNSPVPEAGSLALFSAGLLALGALIRRRAN